VVFVPLTGIIRIMKRGGKADICVLTGVLLGVSTITLTSVGATDVGPYNAIIERNVFNLHAPPPPPNPADLIKRTPPPKIMLTGITTILGQKKTFLTLPPTKPGGPPESMSLAEGQAMYDVEVKRIDEKAGIVEIVNHGEAQTLDFENNGAKPTGAPGPAPMPVSIPSAAAPPPNVMPLPGSVIRPLRSLPPRGPGADNNNGNPNFGGGGMGSAANGMQQNNLTPEEQVALIEIQRVKYQQENNSIGTILPPTEMSGEAQGGGPGGFPAPQ
jgi:hypothetical protein